MILSKTWWRSLVKGDETDEENPGVTAEEADADTDPDSAEPEPEDEEDLRADDEVEQVSSPLERDEAGTIDPEHHVEEDLSQPYDLGVQPRRGGGGRMYRARINSAKEFFSTEILYRFDILETPERSEIAGSYRIELKGYRGGIWTLFLAEDLRIENRREEADIVLSMQQRDFVNLVNGELNPQLAMLSQKMRVSGDIRKASKFQVLFLPSGE